MISPSIVPPDRGNEAKAVEMFQKENCYSKIAGVIMYTRDHQKSEEYFRKADDAKGIIRSLVLQNKFNECEDYLKESDQDKGIRYEGHLELGYNYMAIDDLEKAEGHLHPLLESSFYRHKALLGMAEIHMQKDEWEKAGEFINEILLLYKGTDSYISAKELNRVIEIKQKNI